VAAVQDNPEIPAEQKEAVLQPLRARAEAAMDLPPGATVCRRTRATLAQVESEIEAADAIAAQALRRLIALAAPSEKIERVAVARLFPARIASEAEQDEFLAALRERLEKVLARGASVLLE